MTLSTIEMRLKVFPQYLEYRIDAKTIQLKNRADFWTFFKTQGIAYFNSNPEYLMSFDEWLVYNYSNLIL